MFKVIKYFIISILPFLFLGCAAEIAIINDQLKSYMPSTQTLVINKAKEQGIYLQVDKKFNKNTVRKAIVSNDKRYLVSVSKEKNVIVTDIENKKVVKKLIGNIGSGNNGKVYTVALSPDDKYLVIGGLLEKEKNTLGAIRVYDFKTFKLVKTLNKHDRLITDLDFSFDRKYLISSSTDEKILVWNANDFSFIKEIETDSVAYLSRLVKDKNRYKIFTIEKDNHIKLYDLISGKLLKDEFIGSEINTLSIGRNEVAVGALRYKYIEIYDFDLNKIDKININNAPRNLSYSNDGKYLAVASAYRKEGVFIYDRYKSNKLVAKIKKNIFTLKFIDKNNLLTIDYYNNLNNFNIRKQTNKNLISENKMLNYLGFQDNKLSFSRNGQTYVNDFKKKDYFDLYFDFEKFKIVKKRNEFKTIHEENKEYKLEVKKIKGFTRNVNYLVLSKNNIDIDKKQYSDSYFNTYGFFDDFIVAGGKVNYIYNKNFKKVAMLESNASMTMRYSRYKDFLISLNNENIMEFWDLNNLKNSEFNILYPKLSLYINENNEWVMWTPGGYFNSSENGYRNIGFHINQGYDKEAKWVGIEKLYDHFYRPDLVKLSLNGKDITPYTKGLSYVDVLKNPAPEIKITKANNKRIKTEKIKHYKNKINLEFNVKSVDNGGVGLIRVYQEGKLVKTIGEGEINRVSANVVEDLKTEELAKKAKEEQDKYLSLIEDSITKSMNGTIAESELLNSIELKESLDNSGIHKIKLPLKAGKNRIEIEAFNKTNTVASIREKFTVDAKIKKRRPIVYAIVAGVNKFERTGILKNLNYSENDAKAMKNMLKLKIKDKVVPTLLLGKDFTKENLYKSIKKIKSKSKLEDKIVFYVSTHGKAYKGDLFLVPQNNKKTKDWIKFEDIFKEIQSISALDQVFIIDACESGKAKDIVASIYDSKASVLAKQSGVHVLLATAKGTYAFEHPNPKIKHGVFTNNILTALKSRKTDKNGDRKISVIELSKILRSPEYVTEHQYPVIRNVGQDTKIRDF